jgi:galactokinase
VNRTAIGRIAFAPGRVNLIGEHTDYNEGLALPMAIALGVEVSYEAAAEDVLILESDLGSAAIHPGMSQEHNVVPPWARLAAQVAREIGPGGGRARVVSDLPVGVGLSSSAALGVALALALGAQPLPLEVARLCQRAEHAIGAPVGLMDPLVSMSGMAGHALEIDFSTLAIRPLAIPSTAGFVVIDSGVPRLLDSSPYAQRRAECEAAGSSLGLVLGHARPADLARLGDPVQRRRATHVATENGRVRAFAEAMAQGDLERAGALMTESHRSLRDDFEVSTPSLYRLVEQAGALPGVYGARLTGAGFGGSVLVLCEPGAEVRLGVRTWRVSPSAGAWVRELSAPVTSDDQSGGASSTTTA